MSKELQAVEAYFKTDRSIRGGRNLYNTIARKSLALQSSFAKMLDNPENRAKMHYELAMAVGMQERKMRILLNQPIKEKLEDFKIDTDQGGTGAKLTELTPEDQLIAFTTEGADYFAAKELAKALELEVKSRKKVDLYAALEAAKASLIAVEIESIPLEIKASVKLREQFPFLREKDCPSALKELVNDLITSYEDFKENQPKLHELLKEADAKALVDVVLQDYIENKQAWAELEHYKETNNILGEHPLFERLALKEEITALNTADLTKKIKNLEINIGKNKKKENAELVARDEDLLAHAKAILEKR